MKLLLLKRPTSEHDGQEGAICCCAGLPSNSELDLLLLTDELIFSLLYSRL